jgi:hypothetical protein
LGGLCNATRFQVIRRWIRNKIEEIQLASIPNIPFIL